MPATSGALRIVTDQADPYYSNIRVLDNIFLTHQNTPLIVVFPVDNTFPQFLRQRVLELFGAVRILVRRRLYQHLSSICAKTPI